MGLGLCAPGLMFVGLLAALEGWYRMTLRELPALPTPPDATDRLPADLACVALGRPDAPGARACKPCPACLVP
ncbi:hypothetical protein [Corallococcus sp. CA054B]|uniref:hypothetical protein n=1 Tax=Corallococcus sp. CA054B TaxID=2316734 RepID=UPI0011C45018|nr:hypothetical protein [Corallococcus sp. CA054B]